MNQRKGKVVYFIEQYRKNGKVEQTEPAEIKLLDDFIEGSADNGYKTICIFNVRMRPGYFKSGKKKKMF